MEVRDFGCHSGHNIQCGVSQPLIWWCLDKSLESVWIICGILDDFGVSIALKYWFVILQTFHRMGQWRCRCPAAELSPSWMETMSPSEDSKARRAKAGCQKELLDLSGAVQMKTFVRLWGQILMIFDGHCLYPKWTQTCGAEGKLPVHFVSSNYLEIGSGDGG